MIELLNADALHVPLADESVHCIVTSPPYWGLRKYVGDMARVWGGELGCRHEWEYHTRQEKSGGMNEWSQSRHFYGGDQGANVVPEYSDATCRHCSAWYGELGLEPTPEQYIANMVAWGREMWRVLRSDGTLWINLGDSFNEKQLVGLPWRVALALQADGWWLRSDIIWSKPNPMPESVTDRPTKAHEYVFLMTKAARYFYDNDAVREVRTGTAERPSFRGGSYINNMPGKSTDTGNVDGDMGAGRNRRTVWNIATAPYSGAHFATFPPALVEPCVKAGTSERGVCAVCGAPWERVVERGETTRTLPDPKTHKSQPVPNDPRLYEPGGQAGVTERMTTGWRPTCEHDTEPIPATVFDPFAGSGTTLLVARQLGRSAVGTDLSLPYLTQQARKRLSLDALDAWESGRPTESEAVTDLPLFGDLA